MIFKFLIFFILFLNFQFTLSAQIEVPFFVKTINFHSKKAESGISIKAFDQGNIIKSISSDNKGEAILQLPIGKKYRVEFSKPGKVTRFINIDYSQLKDTIKEEDADPRGEVEISLFDDVKGIDYNFVLSNPATNFTYDTNLIYQE